jgi:hypothetical protein
MINHAEGWFRRWFAKVWKVRGGGLYAVGWAVTFAYLEVTTLVGEIVGAEGVVEFFRSQLIEFVFRFIGDSLSNMISAFMWPVEIVQWRPPVGAILLGAAFVLFPVTIKPYITGWLFPDGEPDEEKQA